jgi:predicted O-methyltransferase YrrM
VPLTPRERNALLATGTAFAAGFVYLGLRLAQLSQQLAQHDEDTLWRSIYETRNLQAWTWLTATLDLNTPLPPMRGWAISPDFAAYYVELLREHRPSNVVELGGGTSTILSGLALAQLGTDAHITAIEALAPFASATRELLTRHQVENAAVIHAPLTRTQINRHAWTWYTTALMDELDDIDLLLVDGPAQFRNARRQIRYPALPLLYDRLAPGALILLDDANRDDERRVVARWLREFPALEMVETNDDLEKGAALLRKTE